MKSFNIEQVPNIIAAASKTPLGIFALMIIALSLSGFYFFRHASERTRLIVFLPLLIGVALYGYVVSSTRSTSSQTAARDALFFCKTAALTVNANEIADTKLMIAKGSSIQAVASGEGIKFGFDVGLGYGPSGERRIARHPFPAVGLHELALLAQVGTDFYEVGSRATFIAKNEGTLKLRFNDWKLDDNSGRATVDISVKCP
jgi:hypothetical protein